MEQTRVLLLGVTAVLADLVDRIAKADERLRIVDALDNARDLVEVSRRTRTDVVLTVVDGDQLPAACRELLYARPRVRILGLVDQGHRGLLWELTPHCVAVGELSPPNLLAALLGR